MMMTEMAAIADLNHTDPFDLELFFDLSPDMLCVAGYDGYFKKINPSVSKTLGYSEAELFARPIDSFVHPEDRLVTSKKRENIKKDNALLNFENRYVTKSGEIVWLSWTSMPIKSKQQVFAIAKNITYKKKLEEDRNALLAHLTKINTDLKQLTYATSHDLRLPVSNLLSVFNFLDTTKIKDQETLDFIEMLKLSTESLKETLNDYVDRLTREKVLNADEEDVSLHKCLSSAMNSLSSLIKASNADIDIDLSAFATVRFNKTCLESIFLNLITNSIKYAKHDSFPSISIFTQIVDGKRQLVFADAGQGFDMDNVNDKIFGFSQKFADDGDSKGIGLYLVHNYIITAGGKIRVESKLNEGARFIITFRD